MFCKECGAKIPEGAKFCKECGTPVKVITQTNENVGNEVKASTTEREVLTTMKKPSGNYSVKPNAYNSSADYKLKSEIESLERTCKDGISRLEHEYKDEKAKGVVAPYRTVKLVCIIISVVLFFMIAPFYGAVPFFLLSVVADFVIIPSAKSGRIKEMFEKNYDNNNKEALNSKIASLEEAYRSDVMKANERAEKDKKKYKEGFDAEVLEMSTMFATSDLLAKIVDKMTDKFKREIASLNRATNLEKVSDSFKVNVYSGKVTSNAGTFDFNVERYRPLSSIVEVCGLAKAIQSALYLNMTMECPEDPSGTAAVYSVTEDDDSFVINYSAINGNFVSVKEW